VRSDADDGEAADELVELGGDAGSGRSIGLDLERPRA
jgi:hypothetical protein